MTAEDFIKVPVSKATAVPDKNGFYHLYAHRCWVVTDGCILFYKGPNGKGRSPQCNANRNICETTASRYKDLFFPDAHVRFLERVWESHDCQDYI